MPQGYHCVFFLLLFSVFTSSGLQADETHVGDGKEKLEGEGVSVGSIERQCGHPEQEASEPSKAELWKKVESLAGKDQFQAIVFNRGVDSTPSLAYAKIVSVKKDDLTNKVKLTLSNEGLSSKDYLTGSNLSWNEQLRKKYGKVPSYGEKIKKIERFNIRESYEPIDKKKAEIEIAPADLLGILSKEDAADLEAQESPNVLGRKSLKRYLENWATISDDEVKIAKCIIKKLTGLPEDAEIRLTPLKDGNLEISLKSGDKQFVLIMGSSNSFWLYKPAPDNKIQKVSETFVTRQSRDGQSLGKLMWPPLRDAVATQIAKGRNIETVYELGTDLEPRYLVLTEDPSTKKVGALYVSSKESFESPGVEVDNSERSNIYVRIQNKDKKTDTVEIGAGFGAVGVSLQEGGKAPRPIYPL